MLPFYVNFIQKSKNHVKMFADVTEHFNTKLLVPLKGISNIYIVEIHVVDLCVE